MTNANLENHTGAVSLDELFKMRMHLVQAINELQSDDEGMSASIEGDGFNIAFGLGGKKFFLRCEADHRG